MNVTGYAVTIKNVFYCFPSRIKNSAKGDSTIAISDLKRVDAQI